MEILYEDRALLVAVKPPHLSSESCADQSGFADLVALRNPTRYVGVIHRLDRGVGGVMVYAYTPQAAAKLSEAVRTREMKKEYLAIVHGVPDEPTGKLVDLLFHDRCKNKTFAVDRMRRGVKEAVLEYEVQKSIEHPTLGRLSLLRIQLQTGRTHQIRVQFSHRGYPLLGDRKYGAPSHGAIGLFSHRLTFSHPKTQKELCLCATPSGEIWDLFA